MLRSSQRMMRLWTNRQTRMALWFGFEIIIIYCNYHSKVQRNKHIFKKLGSESKRHVVLSVR